MLSTPAAAAAASDIDDASSAAPAPRRRLHKRSRFIDDEAAQSGGDSGDDADEGTQGSLEDFIAEPSQAELARVGLVFESSDDDDPMAVLRNARPFARYRRMGADDSARRRPEARPVTPDPGDAALGMPEGAGGQFIALVKGCAWLDSAASLFDSDKSSDLLRRINAGYVQEKYRRQAKEAPARKPGEEVEQPGSLELTAVVDYCVHILTEQLHMLWAGGTHAPGEKVAGSLMRADPAHPAVCQLVSIRDAPLDLSTLLLSLVLAHPRNTRWQDLVLGRKMYRQADLIYLVQIKLPVYEAKWSLVAYSDGVFDMSTGQLHPLHSFDAAVSGYCAKRMSTSFPKTFQLPRTIGILAAQGYGLYAVLVLFAFLGRMLFPLGSRDNWIQLLFLLGRTQTGKTTLYRMLTEGCMEPSTVRSLPSDPRYPLGSLFSPPGARMWSNGDTLMSEFLKYVSEEMLLKLIDGSSQAYWRKNNAALELRNTLPGMLVSNRHAGDAAGDAGGSMSVRIVYFPFFRPVSDSHKDTTLVARMLSEEAPVFLVVCSTLYRALTIAVGSQNITCWYPSIVAKVKAEVQEGLHGFIRWLNANTTQSDPGESFVFLSDAIDAYTKHVKSADKQERTAWDKVKGGGKLLLVQLKEAGYKTEVTDHTAQASGGGGASGAAASAAEQEPFSPTRARRAPGSGGNRSGGIAAEISVTVLLDRKWLRLSAAQPRKVAIMEGGLPPTDGKHLTRMVASMFAALGGNFTTFNSLATPNVGGALVKLVYWLNLERKRDLNPSANADDAKEQAEYRPPPNLQVSIERDRRARPPRAEAAAPIGVVVSMRAAAASGDGGIHNPVVLDGPVSTPVRRVPWTVLAAAANAAASPAAASQGPIMYDGMAQLASEQRRTSQLIAAASSRTAVQVSGMGVASVVPAALVAPPLSASDDSLAVYGPCTASECGLTRIARQKGFGSGSLNDGRWFLTCRQSRGTNEHNKASWTWRDEWYALNSLPLLPQDATWRAERPQLSALSRSIRASASSASTPSSAPASSQLTPPTGMQRC